MVHLDKMYSAWSAEERKKLNTNWDRLMAGLAEIHRKLNMIANGDFDKLLEDINESIAIALQAGVDTDVALALVEEKLTIMQTAINNANAATANANTAAADAYANVSAAITMLQQNITDFKDSYNHKADFSATVQYRKNNEIVYNGSTYRAKKDVLGFPPPPDLNSSNEYWQLIARRGVDAIDSELTGVWRGPTPPTNLNLLWWKDESIPVGHMTYVYISPTPPPSPDYLWVRTKGAV